MESRLCSHGIDTNSFVGDSMKTSEKRKLFRKERECYRFMNVKKMKVFFFFEKIRRRSGNIFKRLELKID